MGNEYRSLKTLIRELIDEKAKQMRYDWNSLDTNNGITNLYYTAQHSPEKIHDEQLEAIEKSSEIIQSIIPVKLINVDKTNTFKYQVGEKYPNLFYLINAPKNSTYLEGAPAKALGGKVITREVDKQRVNLVYRYDARGKKIIKNRNGLLNFTYLHEIGHILGLDHPKNMNEIRHDCSTMSYGKHPDYKKEMGRYTYPISFGPMDILALQSIYGVNLNHEKGNTVYDIRNDKFLNKKYTIWDAGGIDTIDASGNYYSTLADMRDGETSSTRVDVNGFNGSANHYGTFSIAYMTDIENYIGSTHGDLVITNKVDNHITLEYEDDLVFFSDTHVETLWGDYHGKSKIPVKEQLNRSYVANGKLHMGWGSDVIEGEEGKNSLDTIVFDVSDPLAFDFNLKETNIGQDLLITHECSSLYSNNIFKSDLTIKDIHKNQYVFFIRLKSNTVGNLNKKKNDCIKQYNAYYQSFLSKYGDIDKPGEHLGKYYDLNRNPVYKSFYKKMERRDEKMAVIGGNKKPEHITYVPLLVL